MILAKKYDFRLKYDFSQESTVPLIPNRVDNKMEWSTVSKAADKSSRSRITELLLSIAVRMSL